MNEVIGRQTTNGGAREGVNKKEKRRGGEKRGEGRERRGKK